MQLFSYANLHKVNQLVKLKDELREIYLNQAMQMFAISLIGIFIPIYLLESGFDIFMIFNYYIIFSVSNIIFSFFLPKVYSRIGLKHTIFISTVPLIIQYMLLQYIGHFINYSLFYLIPVIQGLWVSLYWLPLHSEFVKHSHKIREGNEIGNLIALPKISATFGPTLGALVLKSSGFDTLFLIVIAMVMLSVGPLFLTEDSKKRFHYNIRDFVIFFKNRSHLYLAANGIYFLSEVLVWPLFVYILFGDIMSIGILATISSLGIVLFTFIIGRFANKGTNKRKLMKLGGILYGSVLILRAFVSDMTGVYILSFMGGMFSTLLAVSIYARFCDEARSGNIIAFNVSRHFWISLGRMLPIIFILYAFGFEVTMIFSGLAIMLLLFL